MIYQHNKRLFSCSFFGVEYLKYASCFKDIFMSEDKCYHVLHQFQRISSELSSANNDTTTTATASTGQSNKPVSNRNSNKKKHSSKHNQKNGNKRAKKSVQVEDEQRLQKFCWFVYLILVLTGWSILVCSVHTRTVSIVKQWTFASTAVSKDWSSSSSTWRKWPAHSSMNTALATLTVTSAITCAT